MKDKSNFGSCLKRLSIAVLFLLVLGLPTKSVLAVTSKITRQSSNADFLKGKAEDIVISSKGTIQLGRSADTLAENFEDISSEPNATKHAMEPWAINSIVVNGGTIFVGTSPNGGIYKYSLGKLTKIYPSESDNFVEQTRKPDDTNKPADANENEPNVVLTEKHLANEHIFVMAADVAGRLLAGISGAKCRLMRLEANKMKTVFEPNDATKYIFAMVIDGSGNIYLGTGPEGKIYRLNSFGKEPNLFYDSPDKNILSLAVGRDGFVYAGSDTRGLIYKINPRTQQAAVLYDSDLPEITALLFTENGDLYAAATSANIAQTETEFASQPPPSGRPDTQAKPEGKTSAGGDDGLKLKVANTQKETDDKASPKFRPARQPGAPVQASSIYKVTAEGFVTTTFSQAAVFFCLVVQDNTLLVGTGNNAQLFTVEPASEQETIIYKDKQATQITALAVAGDDVYLGTANPARLMKLGRTFAAEGTYNSDLIDAGQPADWGKLQIDADIPQNCQVMATSRSGNVSDVNDPTFSRWTEPVEIKEPVQLGCPMGRFCQYKLLLRSENGQKSPVVREIAVASTIPNIAPQVESVGVGRIEAPGKTGFFKISYIAKDENGDKLLYKIDFRKIGRTNWIELKDKIEVDNFEWDAKTVEDGRYEIRVTANDQRSNTPETALTGSRVSEPVIVDNTAPVIKKYTLEKAEKTVTLKLHVSDELSAIGMVSYAVDSNAEWTGAIPDDLVYDTTDENITIVIEKMTVGEHVITVRVSDDVGNTMYETMVVTID